MFSSNKTKIYDEDLEKHVVLFPGLEVWAFISKPKAKIFADVIDLLTAAYNKQTEETYK